MLPTMYDTERATSPQEIDAVEARLGIELPAEYRAWLFRFNGGQPKPGTFHFKGVAEHSESVAWFFAVYDGEYNNFETEYWAFKMQARRLPDALVPIADDGLGNIVCLAITGPDVGKIFFWDHELESDTGTPTYDNCRLVADSFGEFIDMLGSPIPGEADRKAAARRAVEVGAFPFEVERQCNAIESEFPDVRKWIRKVGLALYDKKGMFCFHNDPLSFTFLDFVLWMKQMRDGAESLHTSTEDVLQEWHRLRTAGLPESFTPAAALVCTILTGWTREADGGFGLGGYGPGFVTDWLKDRAKAGDIALIDENLRFTSLGESGAIDRFRSL